MDSTGDMENAEWPSTPVAESVKKLIARFYELVDSTDPESSEKLANTVFVEDGKFVINKREMVGRDGGPTFDVECIRIMV